MGQIISEKAIATRCNLLAIQSGGSKASEVLADGEIWLVDSTNANKGADGFGLYDSYIVGDGTTAASSLTVNKIDELDPMVINEGATVNQNAVTEQIAIGGAVVLKQNDGYYIPLTEYDYNAAGKICRMWFFSSSYDDSFGEVNRYDVFWDISDGWSVEEYAVPTNDKLSAALAGKQDTISDLSTIRSGAAAGATAVQPATMNTALAAKQDTIITVNVTVDDNTGTPSGSASVSGRSLSLTFQNLKGATGAQGPQGIQGVQGVQGPKGDTGVTGDASSLAIIHGIDKTSSYGTTDVAGADAAQDLLNKIEGGFYY